jgi:hypothetical protein
MITNIGEVEKFMDDFVINRVCGRRVDEYLDKIVSFKNADYQIDYLELFIELKSLEENQAENKSFLDKLSDFHQPHLEYLTSSAAKGRDAEELARETLTRYTRDIEKAAYPRIKKIIAKANKQLKETKAKFDLDNFSGVVWIVNDNNLYLTIENQLAIVSRILASEFYSSVDSVVLSNLNMQIVKAEDDVPHLYWVPIFRSGISEKTWQSVHYLGHCWQEHIRKVFEIPESSNTMCGHGEIKGFIGFSNIKYTTK